MLRKAFFAVMILAACFGAVWLADHPGSLTVNWLGYEVKTSASFLALSLFFIAALLWLCFSLIRGLLHIPAEFRQSRVLLQHQKGLDALTNAFLALSEQNHAAAKGAIDRAERLLPDPTLARLMQLQLSRQKGDEPLLHRQFKQLEESPQTRPLALRGLMEEARSNGRTDEALRYAESLLKVKPKQVAANMAVISLYSAKGRWQEAIRAINSARFKQVLSGADAAKLKAVVHQQQAEMMLAQKNRQSAIATLKKAHGYDPSLTAPTMALASIYKQQGKNTLAAKLIRQSWKLNPHPALSDLFLSLYEALSADKQFKKVQELTKPNREMLESQIALAKAALAAEKYDDARNHLKLALSKQETVRVCRLMAELEQIENAENPTVAKSWLERAASAGEEASWRCNHCDTVSEQWHAHCPQCNQFNSVAWTRKTAPVFAQASAA